MSSVSSTPTLLASAVTLTGSAVASTNPCYIKGDDQQTLFIKYTPGATSNVLTVTIEFTTDDESVTDANATWYQDQEWSDSSGVLTRVLRSLSHTASGTGVVALMYDVPHQANRMRIKWAETASVYGTITSWVFSRPTSA